MAATSKFPELISTSDTLPVQDGRQCFWNLKVRGFLRRHGHSIYRTPTKRREILELYSLHSLIELFVDNYPYFVDSVCSGNPQMTWLPRPRFYGLDKTERARIKRGFLRYEFCCRLFGIPALQYLARKTYHLDKEIFSMELQYLRTLPPWEVEEVRPVGLYVRRQYDLIFNENELFFRNSVRNLATSDRHGRSIVDRYTHWTDPLFDHLKSQGFTRLSYTASMMGLQYLRQILDRDLYGRASWITRTCQVAEHYPGHPFPCDDGDIWMLNLDLNREDPSSVHGTPPAWRHVLHAEWKSLQQRFDRPSLRELGWVFWNENWLLSHDIFSFRYLKVPQPVLSSAPRFRSPRSLWVNRGLFYETKIGRHGLNWLRRTFGLKQYSYAERLRRNLLILETLSRDPLYRGRL